MAPTDHSKNLRRILAEGKNLDEALSVLRMQGVSILECVIAVRNFRRCDIGEAKRLVHFSPAWKDVVDRTEQEFRELCDEPESQPAKKE